MRKKLSFILIFMITVLSFSALSFSTFAGEVEVEQGWTEANPGVVYFVNCGVANTSPVLWENYSDTDWLGAYQTNLDQDYDENVDDKAGYGWGRKNSNTWYKNSERGDNSDDYDKFYTLVWGHPETEIQYYFELPNGDYKVEVGFYDRWGTRNCGVKINDVDLTGENDIVNEKFTKTQRVFDAEVTDGKIDLTIKNRNFWENKDISLSYIIITEVITPVSSVKATLKDPSSLPNTIDVTRNNATVSSQNVVWNTDAVYFDIINSGTVSGKIIDFFGAGQDLGITADLIVAPTNLKYFIEGGVNTNSQFSAISGLKNDVINQKFEQGVTQWGYLNDDADLQIQSGADMYSAVMNFHGSVNGKTISYKLSLDSGYYKLHFGLFDPWYEYTQGSRQANIDFNGDTVISQFTFTDERRQADCLVNVEQAGQSQIDIKPINSGSNGDIMLSFILVEEVQLNSLNWTVAPQDKTYDGNLAEYSVTATQGGDITYKFYKSDGAQWEEVSQLSADSGRYKIEAASAAVLGFEGITEAKEFEIKKADGEDASDYFILAASYGAIYGNTLNDVSLPNGWLFNDDLSTSVGNATTAGNVFDAAFTSSNPNYKSVFGQAKIIVDKAESEYTIPSASAVFGDTLEDISLPTGWSFEDGLSTSVGNATAEGRIFKATFTPTDLENYKTAEGIDVTVIVLKASYSDIKHESLSVTYTKDNTLADLSLSSGFSWVDGSAKLTATQSEYAAKYNLNKENYLDFELSITVNVAKASYKNITYDALNAVYTASNTLSDITLVSGYAWLDGTSKLTVAQNKYAAKYNLDIENYIDFELDITVNVAKGIIDMTGVSFENYIVKYDGESKSILAKNLPKGVTAEYVGNDKTEVGEYFVTVKFIYDNENYEDISDMTATLKIEKDTSKKGCGSVIIGGGTDAGIMTLCLSAVGILILTVMFRKKKSVN